MVGIEVRANMSPLYIQSATLFARQSWEVEGRHGSKTLEQLHGTGVVEDDQSYAVGAAFCSVAFLEAAIKELFDDMVGGTETSSFKQLDPSQREKMARWWELKNGSNARTLAKFQGALYSIEKDQFDPAESPFQDADDLIELRNELVHYRPEFIPAGVKVRHDIIKRLEGKFPINPWYKGTGNPFYPKKCLGHGCAEWAMRSALSFADEFFARMGIAPPYDSQRPRLGTR